MGLQDDPWLPIDPDTGDVPLSRRPIPTRVEREDRYGNLMNLDNVAWEEIAYGLGTDPGTCRLRYRLGIDDPAAPQTFEDCLSDTINYPKTIQADDRIRVWATRPDGEEAPLFDGLARGFSGRIAAGTEEVVVQCQGIACRMWDAPFSTSTWRNGDDPGRADNDATIDASPHFNPKGRGNCSPGNPEGDEYWSNQDDDKGDRRYPVFFDPDSTSPEPVDPRDWDLSRLARYAIFTGNPGEDLVKNPDGSELDEVLVGRNPIAGVLYDPTDPESYTVAEVSAPDKPAGGKAWPDLVHDVVSAKGFETAWDLGVGDDGGAETAFRVLDPQQGPIKSLWLQPRGSELDGLYTNLGAAAIGRDITQVADRWLVEGELEEVEASYILACVFPTVPADAASSASLAKFDKTSATYLSHAEAYYTAYRDFVLDESGEGHYAPGAAVLSNDVPSLDAVLGAEQVVDGKFVAQYAIRRRKPLGDLVTADVNGVPVKATLEISTDYSGECPSVWTGKDSAGNPITATWQPCVGNWESMKDRIGIRINCKNPNEWHIGQGQTGQPFQHGLVKVVESLCKNTAANPIFYLRYTCKTYADKRVKGLADVPLNGVLNEPVLRVVDAHDRYKKQRIVLGSANLPTNPDDPGKDKVVRDDTDLAYAEAVATQVITQNGVLAGSATIPRITTYYAPGDRVDQVNGRGVGFRTDSGGDAAAPTYPVVTRVTLVQNRAGQFTHLSLSDADAGRHSYLKQLRRRPAPRNA